MKISCFGPFRQLSIPKKKVIDCVSALCSLEQHAIQGELRIILLNNKEIHRLNKRFLNHDYPTDVLAFPLEEREEFIEGEVYINVEAATQQAREYRIRPEEELWRLIFHGVLHLLGYDDGNEQSRIIMSQREDWYLQRFELTERVVE